MPLDPGIALNVGRPDPISTIQSFITLGRTKTALDRERGTLDADISAAQSKSALAGTEANVASQTAGPRVQEQTSRTALAGTEANVAAATAAPRIATAGSTADTAATGAMSARFKYATEKQAVGQTAVSALITHPAVKNAATMAAQGTLPSPDSPAFHKLSNDILDEIENTKDQMTASGQFSRAEAAALTAPLLVQATHNPAAVQQTLIKMQQQAAGSQQGASTQASMQTPQGVAVSNGQQSGVVQTNNTGGGTVPGQIVAGTGTQAEVSPNAGTANPQTGAPQLYGPQGPAQAPGIGGAGQPMPAPAQTQPAPAPQGQGTAAQGAPSVEAQLNAIINNPQSSPAQAMDAFRRRQALRTLAGTPADRAPYVGFNGLEGAAAAPPAAAPVQVAQAAAGPPAGARGPIATGLAPADAARIPVHMDYMKNLQAQAGGADSKIEALEKIRAESKNMMSGEGAEYLNKVAGLFGQVGFTAGQDARTSTDLVKKYSAQLAGGFGGANTDAGRMLEEMSNPNFKMTDTAAAVAATSAIGLAKMQKAEYRYLSQFQPGSQAFVNAQNSFNDNKSQLAFAYASAEKPERDYMLSHLGRTPDERAKAKSELFTKMQQLQTMGVAP